MNSDAALEISHLCKRFAADTVVNDLSFRIEPGEVFGLLGPNGAGKSTTINMIAGVTRIDAGTISIFGYDNRREYRHTRQMTGVMHQEIVTDSFFTIDRALDLHPGYYGVRLDPLWRDRLVDRLGLGPHLHKPMIKLSGGLKRRFMVAKALIHKPRLLIVDEPTAGVDVELRHSLWEFVQEINAAGTTVLLTTHYLEEAQQMCGRLAILNQGELIALEETSSLLRRLGRRTLRVRLAAALTEMPADLAARGGELGEEGHLLTLPLPPGENPGRILQQICTAGLEVADLETIAADLEDVFIDLTGIAASQNGGGQ